MDKNLGKSREVAACAIAKANLTDRLISGVDMLCALYEKIGYSKSERYENAILYKAETIVKAQGFNIIYK